MTRTVTMDPYGNFTVTDDPRGVLAIGSIATTTENAAVAEKELAPDGRGLRAPATGVIERFESRDDLPPPYDEDPALDPETQELWRVFRERDNQYGRSAQMVIFSVKFRQQSRFARRKQQQRDERAHDGGRTAAVADRSSWISTGRKVGWARYAARAVDEGRATDESPVDALLICGADSEIARVGGASSAIVVLRRDVTSGGATRI